MKIFPNRSKEKKDNSLGLFHGEAAAVSAESAGCQFQSASLVAVGANATNVAFLSAFTNLVLALLLIKVPSLVEGKTPMKRTVIMISFINACTWIPIIFVFLFLKNINPVMLIGLWIFGLVPATLLGPLRDNWLSNLVPSDKMGRYLSWRAVLAGLFYLAAYNIMGFILYKATGNIEIGFGVVLGVAFLASITSTFLYSRIHSPAPAAKSQTAPSLTFINFLKGAMKEHLGTFILFASLFNFAVNLSSPLLTFYMLNNLKFNFMTLTLVFSCEYVARVISITFWGKMVDKSGSLRVLGIVSHLIPIVPVLWIFSGGNVFYLCMAQLFSGTVWAAFDLCSTTFIYKSTQREQRLHYIAYYRSLTTFSAALGTLTSAVLLSSMFHIFGSQILAMLLLSAILRMAVVRIMLPKLKPGGIPDAIVHEELARELAMVNYPTRQGLYYHPEVWSRFTKPVVAFGTIIGNAVTKIVPRSAGLYYNPQKWSTYMGQNPNLQPGMIQDSNSEPEKSGIYYNKKAWAEYMQQTAVPIESDEESTREGLLYNREAWATMVNQTTGADAKTLENSKPIRKGLLNDPETLAAVASQTARAEAKRQESLKPAHKGLLYDPEAWTIMVNQLTQANAKFSESLKPARKGLLNDPEAMARFISQTAMAEAKAIGTVKTTRTGIFYDLEKWSDYLKQSMVLNATTMRTNGDIQTNRQPIFYHPEIWNDYKNRTALSGKVAAFKNNARVTTARQPLLYHPEEWDRTFDPAMVHIGRKSAIGNVIIKQNQFKKIEGKQTPARRQPMAKPTMITKTMGVRPSMA